MASNLDLAPWRGRGTPNSMTIAPGASIEGTDFQRLRPIFFIYFPLFGGGTSSAPEWWAW